MWKSEVGALQEEEKFENQDYRNLASTSDCDLRMSSVTFAFSI